MASKRTSFLMKNQVLHTLLTAEGNQRVCLWTEPMWGVPYFLFMPMAAVYMAAIGLDPIQIGTITTVSLISQTVAAAFSGVLTDKLGRRLCTAIFDVFAWVIPSILWATAQGYWSFFVAAIFNGCWRVTNNSWSLLLTEDAKPDKLIHLYAISSIAGLVAGFVAPLTYLLVQEFTLISTMRGLYAFMALSMAIKSALLYRISRETSVGLQRMEETRGKSIFTSLFDSRHVLKGMLRSRRIMLTVGISTCFILIRSVNDNFWPLLLTEKLAIPEELLSLFSTVRTVVMLILSFLLVPKLDARRFLKPLSLAMGLIIAVDLTLFMLNQAVLGIIVACVVAEATALSALTPLIPTLTMQALDRLERSRMLSLATTMALLVSAPFGTVAGLLSKLDRGLPMLLNIALALLAVFIAMRLERASDRAQTAEA